jgi:hypothetical protein
MIENAKTTNGFQSYDDFFTRKDKQGKEKPSIVSQLNESAVIDFLPDNKPTEDDLEIIEDKKLEHAKPEQGIQKKKKGTN